MKRQFTKGEKIFANDVTNKRLLHKIFQQLIYPIVKNKLKRNKQKKRADDLNIHFQKKDIQMGNTHIKILDITNFQRNVD